MLQNWTTTLIDDTNLFMRLYSSCYNVGIIWKPIFFFFFFLYVICYDWTVRNVRKVIILDAMSKSKCSKIASLFEIQHDVLFRREFRYNERAQAQWARVHTLTKGTARISHKNPITFATLPFWHCPQFTHPTHASVKQSEQIRHQSKGK